MGFDDMCARPAARLAGAGKCSILHIHSVQRSRCEHGTYVCVCVCCCVRERQGRGVSTTSPWGSRQAIPVGEGGGGPSRREIAVDDELSLWCSCLFRASLAWLTQGGPLFGSEGLRAWEDGEADIRASVYAVSIWEENLRRRHVSLYP